ncbi:hypothetical protein [Vibrio vulnificus]|uniref:hypothetical protein n=1 Tax=Vibrio vulnificus TaxID=672 RepID=UPI0015938CCD|nr:hypothetical protein [Vibrio vulnificus]EGQ8090549.1 hypothetical protein [Vibrio vulnificus]EHH0743573.1 hypothetical protein [Vibrio vulnificus]EJE8554841.1 hypothetical protein [Vibrio vulnificus]NVD21396.1 hypothetical protein [Vibrio vulnificus]
MKKLTLISLISTISAAPAFAVTGDTSTGSAVFSGFVPGFVANGDLIVTGAGGNQDTASFIGTLQVNGDGTFETTKPIVLEAHDYTGAVLGAKIPANWTVSQVTVLPAAMNEVQPNVVVGDKKTSTELTATQYLAASPLSAGEDIQLYVSNAVPHTNPDSIAGSEVIVNVDLIATQP